MTFANGDAYHGEWKADKMTGEGSYMYANGDIFSGRFESGIRSGKGTYEFAVDKSLFVGEWADNTITNGKWVFKDGGSYVGRFENGTPLGTACSSSRAASSRMASTSRPRQRMMLART